MTGEDAATIEDVYELSAAAGFCDEDARGRVATPAAYTHMGRTPQGEAGEQLKI